MKLDKVEYKYEEIFEEDPDNPENLLMKIPDEILEKQGWKEGTPIKVQLGDQGSIIITEIKDDDAKE